MYYVRNEKGKVVQSEGIELPSGEMIKSLQDEKGYKYLGILQLDLVKSKEMEDMKQRNNTKGLERF